jgi:hypothetical protein
MFRVNVNNNTASADASVLGNGQIRHYSELDLLKFGVNPLNAITPAQGGFEFAQFDPVSNSGRITLTFTPLRWFSTIPGNLDQNENLVVHPQGASPITRRIDSLNTSSITLIPPGTITLTGIRLERLNP